jgi:AraC-like DNA-binding protein
MDALSEVLGHVRLKDTNWACFVASSPWGVSFRETKGCVRFHSVARGGCWLSVDKSSQPRIALSSGDLAVLPQGHGHAIRDQPRSNATKFDELLRRTESGTPGVVHHVKVGGAGAETSMIYGAFMIDDPFETPMLATLPSVIRITPDVGEAVPSFLQNLQFISRELDSDRPGSQIVRTRMADVIFVQVLRAYIESLPEGSEGFLGALRDKHMAAALGLMHQRPEEQWTVAQIADQVGLSRSGFAARFAELVGEAPLGYLTRLRMQRASMLLREGATLSKASQMTGYASEASFSHAFRQWAGVAPGAYRRSVRAGAASERATLAAGPTGVGT